MREASKARLSALAGLDNDFAAFWDSGQTAKAWLRQLESCAYEHIWPYFFSGSLLISESDAEPQVVAFYNPYADAALLTAWSRFTDGDRISDAAVILGTELDPAKRDDGTGPPRWCRREGSLPERLLGCHADFRRDFPLAASRLVASRGGVHAAAQNRSLRQLEQRCLALSVELARLCATQSAESTASAVADLMRSLANGSIGEPPMMNDAAHVKFLALGRHRLSRMRPTFANQFSDGSVVMLIDPMDSSIVLAAHFSGAGSSRLLSLSAHHYHP